MRTAEDEVGGDGDDDAVIVGVLCRRCCLDMRGVAVALWLHLWCMMFEVRQFCIDATRVYGAYDGM